MSNVIVHLLLFPVGLVYATCLEWLIHQFLFHKIGKLWKPASFHWAQHHRDTLRHGGADPSYLTHPLSWSPFGREVWGLIGLLALHLPVLAVAPLFLAGAVAGAIRYAAFHRRCHLDPAWCFEHAPWHWDHHMGRNPEANWCVTSDWLDRLVGTRVPGPATLAKGGQKLPDKAMFPAPPENPTCAPPRPSPPPS